MSKLCFRADGLPLVKWLRICVIGLLTPLLSGGCVALNIPSVRYEDPEDRGGLFGAHRPAASTDTSSVSDFSGEQVAEHSAPCVTCGDDELEELEDAPQAKPPEVPWPRFHPLPTRPVFTAPSGL